MLALLSPFPSFFLTLLIPSFATHVQHAFSPLQFSYAFQSFPFISPLLLPISFFSPERPFCISLPLWFSQTLQCRHLPCLHKILYRPFLDFHQRRLRATIQCCSPNILELVFLVYSDTVLYHQLSWSYHDLHLKKTKSNRKFLIYLQQQAPIDLNKK